MVPGKPFKPMEPVAHGAPFDDESFVHQVKFDGVRIIAHSTGRRISLWNRRGHERTAQYPEVVKELGRLLPQEDFILDGEMIAIVNGRPNFHAVLRRDWAADPSAATRLAGLIPIVYVVFDILHLNRVSLISRTLEERTGLLSECVPRAGLVSSAETYRSGLALFESVKNLGLEGIVSKKRKSRYLPGKKSREWLKIKHRMEAVCVIGGYIMKNNSVTSLLLGIRAVDGTFAFVGRCPIYLRHDDSERLREVLGPTQEVPLFEGVDRLALPAPSPEAKTFWVEPEVWCRVEFQEWTDKGLLRQPRLMELLVRGQPASFSPPPKTPQPP